ncbi:AGL303Wp [Eremothecium gossypii ATCC 10895]|uniref:Glutamyl-tRNA(Gln) amidotransferase subunit B, mitochondrial n=1 Tax=Eremothecium gossypii (strain ATCC 10895 / CBS 109.51 / FGSC 9923 / NRRL Y-1056) TaxID=284811 RepID=GATB_EREGS|nr:AGL303Wp [Eremothecium gossypii ATCC 10895]Q751Q9.1 RecName: Full=Glutamyl-tRNA(Gln) amidotransferase subunit B, mitochondrial; Short=Glu-AdT subunit B; Flags: Precursor [Eremothecium gossypii ATCC 10895]AAS54188.1 AGL303Wp [Eremothecium gossypii ATCC 10895]AEY98514.1 FAGL303Wp [Eremothecium gossypii FDAG1]
MLRVHRLYSTRGAAEVLHAAPKYALRCGLEIHTQLNTRNKLFSLSTNDPFQAAATPNYHTSFFDISLPGTQPRLNYEAVLYAIKLSLALDCRVNLKSQFDRKHYFYGDQPLGYQITQHYNPIAKDGKLCLYGAYDNIPEDEKTIGIIQLQLEQDTGRSLYKDTDGMTLIDLNRSNVPLVEMVTQPDFTDVKQVRAFVKKYQNLVRHLNISTGDLETGAMRVDVNMSVNGHARVELKNLPNTSSITNAIRYEYQRQVDIIRSGQADKMLKDVETRGWTGSATIKLRSKESTIDYRYMPDPEIPVLLLEPEVVHRVATALPELPDQTLRKLMAEPYNLSLKDAKILTTNSNSHGNFYTHHDLRNYFMKTFQLFTAKTGASNSKLPANWIIHELLGIINKLEIPLPKILQLLPASHFAEFLALIHDNELSKSSAKLLLFHIINDFKESHCSNLALPDFRLLIEQYNLNPLNEVEEHALTELCQYVLRELNDDALVADLVSGKKKNALKFLLGKGMRLSQGKVDPALLEGAFKSVLGIKW